MMPIGGLFRLENLSTERSHLYSSRTELDNTELRVEETKRRISQLEIYLGSAGSGVEQHTPE
jgi:hypothetical protein